MLECGRFSAPVVLDKRETFKGCYLTAFESLPEGSTEVPCFFGDMPDTGTSGHVMRVALPMSGGGDDDAPPPPPPFDDFQVRSLKQPERSRASFTAPVPPSRKSCIPEEVFPGEQPWPGN